MRHDIPFVLLYFLLLYPWTGNYIYAQISLFVNLETLKA